MTGHEARAAAVRAARAAADKQAADVRVLAVGDLIVITDYFVIASGATDRQVKAIVEAVQSSMHEAGRKPVRREGLEDMHWVLLDYADVVVHVFLQEMRDFYELERLWRDAPIVPWEDPAAATGEAGA